MRYFFTRLLPVILVLFFSYWAVEPLFVSGFFPMHDDTQPARIFEMAKALSAGQFPVRWVSDLGYGFGYPLFNFYAPFPYYIGGLFNLIGFDAISATKIMFIIGILFSSVSMFFLGQELAGIFAGLTASILYLYGPYHAVNIYVRGAVGEFFAFGFLPLIILGIVKIIKAYSYSSGDPDVTSGESKRWGMIIGSLGLAGIFLSHNILGMITGFFLAFFLIIYSVYILLKKQKFSVIFCLLSVILLGFGLSAFFILPAIAEKKYTKVDTLITGGSDFHQNFVYPDQLWNSPWGFAGSAPDRADGMSFKIGKIHLLIGFISFVSILILYKRRRLARFHFLSSVIFYLLFILSVFLMLEQSKFLWEIIPGFAYIQYPWRFLNFTLLSLSILPFVLFTSFKKQKQLILSVVFIIITLWFNVRYFQPQMYLPVKPEDYTSDVNLHFKISKISDEYLPQDFKSIKDINQIALQGISDTDSVKVKVLKQTPTKKEYLLNMVRSANILTNITFFPGWKAQIDDKEMKLTEKDGKIELLLPKGEYKLALDFVNTPVRSLANTISLFSLILLVYVSLFGEKLRVWGRNILSK